MRLVVAGATLRMAGTIPVRGRGVDFEQETVEVSETLQKRRLLSGVRDNDPKKTAFLLPLYENHAKGGCLDKLAIENNAARARFPSGASAEALQPATIPRLSGPSGNGGSFSRWRPSSPDSPLSTSAA